MFLVEKANISSHFRSTTKKSPHIPKPYQLTARLFDEKVIHYLKALDLIKSSSNISLSSLSALVSFLSTVHTEAEDQISKLKPEKDDYYYALYMDYSMKVLDLCNLISSAVHRLTERRMLMNYSLRVLSFAGQMPVREKLIKAKDALTRSVDGARESSEEKGVRAKALIGELVMLIGKLPYGSDIVRRTFYAIGVLTVFVGSVVVAAVYGGTDVVNLRSPAEFLWSDSVNGVQSHIFDLMNSKQNVILEVDDVSKQAAVVCDLLHAVVGDGGDDDGVRVRLVAGVEELAASVKKFSDGVDELTNGVDGLFNTVMKTRNGRLDI